MRPLRQQFERATWWRTVARASADRRWRVLLLIGILALHASLLPRVALLSPATFDREIEHEIEIETASRSGLHCDLRRSPPRRVQRGALAWMQITGGEPRSELRLTMAMTARRPSMRAQQQHRNGTGGPLRC